MSVRFTDPQPGRFPVGSSAGTFTFIDGYHDAVPENIFNEWMASGAALLRVPEPSDTVDDTGLDTSDHQPSDDDAPELSNADMLADLIEDLATEQAVAAPATTTPGAAKRTPAKSRT